MVHMRRALLLFAIVLGLAAVAASLSRSGGDDDPPAPAQRGTETQTETASPGSAEPDSEGEPQRPAGAPVALSFDAAKTQRRRLDAGRPASVEVSVTEPGQVTIPALGLTASAEPVTPARFDVLVQDAARLPILFTPAAGEVEEPAGTLVVAGASG